MSFAHLAMHLAQLPEAFADILVPYILVPASASSFAHLAVHLAQFPEAFEDGTIA